MNHKLHIENVTKVVVDGSITTIHVEEGSSVSIDFRNPNNQSLSPTEVEEVKMKEPVKKPAAKKKVVAKKKEEPSTEEADKEDIPFDLDEEDPVKTDSDEAEIEEIMEEVNEEAEQDEINEHEAADDNDGSFTELEEDDEMVDVNSVFANASTKANVKAAEELKPKAKAKNVFAKGNNEPVDDAEAKPKKNLFGGANTSTDSGNDFNF